MSLATDGPPECPACEKVIMPTWSYCASCGHPLDGDDPEPEPSDPKPQRAPRTDGTLSLHDFPLDHHDADDLRRAYEATDSISEAAEWFEPSYQHVYALLVEAGIHEPQP